ncbi:MAG: SWIM zinc finger family protein [Alicyclobacillus macrosporangiidus]|uniref:SWIM zinc finger family protein n=1 Tax=Alicyclobacillus macrosporangiidus TaxID=392015 RepID=UPI0026EA2CD4|nr:SWIM zinc finger family protein [Alicyclobacillus macrosporangiidus]MCL6598025.1 SWIM zinc finger family protein [Alicyclobacillus macrosporangiidus]
MDVPFKISEIARLGEALCVSTSPATRQRGYDDWQQGRVRSLTFQAAGAFATVSGKRMYAIQLDWVSGRARGYCTCPSDQAFCEHIVAVYLTLIDAVGGDPLAFVYGLGTGLEGLEGTDESAAVREAAALDSAPASPSEPATRTEPSGARSTQEAISPLPAELAQVARAMDEQLESLRQRTPAHQLAQEISWLQDRLLASVPRRGPNGLLARIVAHLCLIHALWLHVHRLRGYPRFVVAEAERAARRSINDFHQWLSEVEERLPEGVEAPETWAHFLRSRCLLPPLISADAVLAAQSVWDLLLLGEPALCDREIAWLRAQEPACPADRRPYLRHMIAYLQAAAGRPAEALAEVKPVGVPDGALVVNTLLAVMRTQKVDELFTWLRWLRDTLGAHSTAHERYVAPVWRILADHHEAARAEYEEMLRARGGREYRLYLLQRDRFEEWADVVMMALWNVPFLAKDEADVVARQKPEALIPVYHHLVERLVDQRQRDAYREAVRVLVRLRKLYHKVKRPDRWEAFIARFAQRHQRLRALQEELRRKGVVE